MADHAPCSYWVTVPRGSEARVARRFRAPWPSRGDWATRVGHRPGQVVAVTVERHGVTLLTDRLAAVEPEAVVAAACPAYGILGFDAAFGVDVNYVVAPADALDLAGSARDVDGVVAGPALCLPRGVPLEAARTWRGGRWPADPLSALVATLAGRLRRDATRVVLGRWSSALGWTHLARVDVARDRASLEVTAEHDPRCTRTFGPAAWALPEAAPVPIPEVSWPF